MDRPNRFLLTNHASVGRVLARPRLRLPDAEDPDLVHALAPITGREERVLRVVYNGKTDPWRVVTAYFDRAWRGCYEASFR